MSVDQIVSTGLAVAPLTPPLASPLAQEPAKPAAASVPPSLALRLRRSRLFQAGIVIYATLALSALLYPQAIVSWLDEFEPNPVVDAAQGCASGLLRLSEKLGIAPLSANLREQGKRLTRRAE